MNTTFQQEEALKQAHLHLNGARMDLVLVFAAVSLQRLYSALALLQRGLEAHDLVQLVVDVRLSVSQLLLQQRDLPGLLANLYHRKEV